MPGHHIQVDVKFLQLKDEAGKAVKQYTAIDDATRIRALQVFSKHNQACAILFMDYVIQKFPFRIHTVRTDRGHEFQAQFHWHVEDLASIMFTSSREPRSSTKKSSDPAEPMKPSFISY